MHTPNVHMLASPFVMLNIKELRFPEIKLPLRSLELQGRLTHSILPISAHDLSIFPPTLTSLRLYFKTSFWFLLGGHKNVSTELSDPSWPSMTQELSLFEKPDFTHLHNLNRLEISGLNVFIGHMMASSLPSTLERFRFDAGYYSQPDYAPCYGPLPTNLRYVSLPNAELTRETLFEGCNLLETVKFGHHIISNFPRIPTSLTKLNVTLDSESNISQLESMAKSSLTKLQIEIDPSHVNLVFDSLPPTLLYLCLVPNDTVRTSNYLTRLPKSLITLRLCNVPYDHNWSWNDLPPNLRKLFIEFTRESEDVVVEFPRNLPNTLTSLSIYYLCLLGSSLPQRSEGGDEQNFSSVKKSVSDATPQDGAFACPLVKGSIVIDSNDTLTRLPSCIKHLTLVANHGEFDPDLLEWYLPPKLKHLLIRTTTHIQPPHINVGEIPDTVSFFNTLQGPDHTL